MSQEQPRVKNTYFNHHLESNKWESYRPRQDDIVIATYIKSGTTWVQTIVSHLIFQDFQTRPLAEVSPWIDTRLWPISNEDLTELLEGMKHRRFIKSHLPLDGLPFYPEVKYIVVGRDLRDVFISLWNHYRNYTADFYQRANGGLGPDERQLPHCPQELREFWQWWMTRGWFEWESDGYPFWSGLHHTRTWWDFRDLPNILLVHYNDLLRDLPGEIRRVARYLEIDVTDELIGKIARATTFDSMKKQVDLLVPDHEVTFRTGADVFVNKGTTGRWRNVLEDEDLALYQAVVDRKLTPDCAHWLENGRL